MKDYSETVYDELCDLLQSEGLKINEINSDRNYWFIRTQGGSYFQDFYFNNFVAIGWDDVPCLEESERTEELRDKLLENYSQPTRVLNQVYRFCKEIKEGDIVIIPAESSAHFAFGYIEDSEIYEVEPSIEDFIEDNKCSYKRRRKTKWISGIPKNRVDSKLYAFFRNQQAITLANNYAEFIDRALNTLYIKNGIAHFTLSVETPKVPRALDIPSYMSGILVRVENIARDMQLIDNPIDETDSDLELIQSRINVQSAGIIELLGDPCFVLLCSVIVIAIFGGSVKFTQHTDGAMDADVGTEGLPGLIKTISDVLRHWKDDKIVSERKMQQTQARLKIKDPREKQKRSDGSPS